MESPEVHQPHSHGRSHGGLPRWLELVIAVTALITSISSIAIAIEHSRIMERLVQANSVPYLEGGISTATPEGDQVLSLDLLNRGVGPAHEESLRVAVDGRPMRSFRDMVTTLLGPNDGTKAYEAFQQTHTLVRNDVPKRFIAAGQQQMVFKLPRTPENAIWWDQLAKQSSRWNVEFCYCSVFDECWVTHATLADDRPVKQCTRDEATEFTP
jgi:hypothetical protein